MLCITSSRFKANRKAWGAPFCLATNDKPHFNLLRETTIDGGMSGLIPEKMKDNKTSYMEVQCFPLYSMLLAVGNPTVNLLSLDIEGAEFQAGA